MNMQKQIQLVSSGKAVPSKIPSYLKALVPERMLVGQCVEVTAAEEILFQKKKVV
ncbi:MAG: hypothetical protein HY832_03665 [Candidatus Aenigmarchaeota archaeon]|nr:hypothetical protein [Candidatus Aenigmarchaeota archaeon]